MARRPAAVLTVAVALGLVWLGWSLLAPHLPETDGWLRLAFIALVSLPLACGSVVAGVAELRHRPLPLLGCFLGGLSLAVAASAADQDALASLGKLVAAGAVGVIVSRVLDHPWYAALIACAVAVIDTYSVFAGPTKTIVDHKPGLLHKLTIDLVAPGGGAPGQIGSSDIVFLALFAAVANRFGLRPRLTVPLLVASFSITFACSKAFDRSTPAGAAAPRRRLPRAEPAGAPAPADGRGRGPVRSWRARLSARAARRSVDGVGRRVGGRVGGRVDRGIDAGERAAQRRRQPRAGGALAARPGRALGAARAPPARNGRSHRDLRRRERRRPAADPPARPAGAPRPARRRSRRLRRGARPRAGRPAPPRTGARRRRHHRRRRPARRRGRRRRRARGAAGILATPTPADALAPLGDAPYDAVVGDLLYSQLLYPALRDARLPGDRIGEVLRAVGQPLTDRVVARLHRSAPLVIHVHDPLAWWDGHEQPFRLADVLAAAAVDVAGALALVATGNLPTGCDPRAGLPACGATVVETALWRWPFTTGVDYLACATVAASAA